MRTLIRDKIKLNRNKEDRHKSKIMKCLRCLKMFKMKSWKKLQICSSCYHHNSIELRNWKAIGDKTYEEWRAMNYIENELCGPRGNIPSTLDPSLLLSMI